MGIRGPVVLQASPLLPPNGLRNKLSSLDLVKKLRYSDRAASSYRWSGSATLLGNNQWRSCVGRKLVLTTTAPIVRPNHSPAT